MTKAALSCLLSLFLLGQTAWAQEPTRSLSDVPSRVQKGERVKVTLRDGTTIKGRFESVTPGSLRLSSREIPGATVREIRRKHPESAVNGLLIGLGVGLAAGAVATTVTCSNDSECSAIALAVFMPTFAGGGAAIGAIIDKSIEKYDPVYLDQSASVRPHLRLSPIVSRDSKGVRISMSF